jgi:hypothetical protein
MTWWVDRFGKHLTQTKLNRLADQVDANRPAVHRASGTSQGSYEYPKSDVIPFPYGDDRVSFWCRFTAKDKIYCAAGNIFIATNAYTFTATSLTLKGSPCYVYLEIPIGGGTITLKKQASLPKHTSSYFNLVLRRYETSGTVYEEKAIYHFGDFHLVAPTVSSSG